jgi:Nucleotidyl transferase AbiEii toxin, Type IV TA system
MKLCEHPDFEQAVIRAAEHFRGRGLRPAIIEKDYYLTETLRIIAQAGSHAVIFKGGTSLSKGWNLIQRFSEDIDIFFDPSSFSPPLGKNAIDRELKKLRDAVASHPALAFLQEKSRTTGGFGRSDRFSYRSRFYAPGEPLNEILVETGCASGREPTADVELRSYVAQFLFETGVSFGADDETGFAFRLLHFRRTFVEKMFAIHAKVEQYKSEGRPVGSYARHYYDLSQLSGTADVLEMLRSAEYAEIKADYDLVSRTHFAKGYLPPTEMSFARSDALFPPAALSDALGRAYEEQCRMLCYGPYPDWDEVLARFQELRSLL